MIKKIFALPVIEQISPVLSRRKLDELDLIVVDHPQVKASFALQGAHLLSWKPAGEEEVLWLSNNTPFKNGVAIRGGIPLCWPWFGPAAQQGLPAHGFARNLPWTLKSHFRVGKTCEIDLESHGEFETTSALHTYFNVGDIAKVSVSGLGDRFIDKVNDAKEDVLTDGIQTFPDRTDRVYLNPQDCSVINDEALNRIIAVGHQHHLNVVGWNPGPALSVSMGDMPDDGYKTFVCVETAYASETQKVTKEKPAHLAQSIRVAKR